MYTNPKHLTQTLLSFDFSKLIFSHQNSTKIRMVKKLNKKLQAAQQKKRRKDGERRQTCKVHTNKQKEIIQFSHSK